MRDEGCQISCTSVGAIASIKERAQKLHEYLSENYAGQSVNLIGHSMGGLDVRYLISHIKRKPYKVLSLATVATPHRGSSFMDFCRDTIGVGHFDEYVKRIKDDAVLTSLDRDYLETLLTRKPQILSRQQYLARLVKPLDAPAFTNLTRSYCAAFNRVTKDDPDVYYSSYAALTTSKIYTALAFSHRIVSEREGENDGIVSLDSAIWGEFKGVVDCDRNICFLLVDWDLVPSSVRELTDNFKKNPFPHIKFYRTVVTHLAEKGF